MLRSINVVMKKAPGIESSTLGIRAAWAMLTSGGYDVNLLCLDEGAYNLRPMPGYMTAMVTRFAEEEGRVLTTQKSLDMCGLSADDLVDGVEIIDASDVAELVAEADATTLY